jgi:hypothetical protein
MRFLHSGRKHWGRAGCACGAGALAALSLTVEAAEPLIDEPGTRRAPGWFVRAGPRVLFNVETTVDALPGPSGAGQYDNGFVLPDISGGNLTWNWGYDSESQVAGDQLNFSRLENAPLESFRGTPVIPGAEVVAGTEFFQFDLGGQRAAWGFEMGYGFNTFTRRHRGGTSGNVNYTEATHELNGVIPPTAPYRGTFEGPGPVIGLNPDSGITIGSAAQSTFDGRVEADLHQLKMGLWMELPLNERFSVALSGGYAPLFADATLRYTEDLTFDNPSIPEAGPMTRRVSGHDWKPGAYAQVRLECQASSAITAYIGGDFQYNDRHRFRGAGREVTLDFQSVFAVSAGVIFSF